MKVIIYPFTAFFFFPVVRFFNFFLFCVFCAGNGSVLGSHLQLCEQNSSGIPLWSKYGKVLLTGLQIMENVLVPNNEEYMVEVGRLNLNFYPSFLIMFY